MGEFRAAYFAPDYEATLAFYRDGLELAQGLRPTFAALGEFARARGLKIWATSRSHREAGELAELVAPFEDLFQVVVGLEPEASGTALNVFKNPSGVEGKGPIFLDTRTLLLGSGRHAGS